VEKEKHPHRRPSRSILTKPKGERIWTCSENFHLVKKGLMEFSGSFSIVIPKLTV
jgi:hypothetical protein